MRRIGRFFVRVSSFITKEIVEILRQPRLILTLVLGPFLILFLFGIGYRNEARALRTLFVVDPNSELGKQVQDMATSLGPQLTYMGTTSDESEARRRLILNQIDVAVLIPANAAELIRNNQQAKFTLLHNEIDPVQVDYVNYFGKVYVDEVNRRVLESGMAQGQQRSGDVQGDLSAARESVNTMRTALQRGDAATARQNQGKLDRQLSGIELAVAAGAGLLGSSTGGQGDNVSSNLAGAREDTNALSNIPEGQSSYSAEIDRLNRIDQRLSTLQQDLSEFQNVSPTIMVSPFTSEAQSIASEQPKIADYFAPAVIVLLLQHLAVTFAALSLVRERRLGAMELFRVSPLSAGETLTGKYISYMIFGAVLAAILTALLYYVLGVPMLGDWGWFALALAAVLFTSLGLGFVISLLSNTDTQAVQLTMIVLLASVFFSGFIMSLNTLIPSVRTVSYMIPATYGIVLLQNIMLRGYFTQPLMLSILAAIGVGLMIIAWLLLRRNMAQA